jgi:uncharacterized SAM-binding protein YcdF (DUF218 family)
MNQLAARVKFLLDRFSDHLSELRIGKSGLKHYIFLILIKAKLRTALFISLGFLLLSLFLCVGFYSRLGDFEKALFIQRLLEVGKPIPDNYGDVILIFGSGCNPGCGTEERIHLAASLYKKHPRKVILSEGNCSGDELRSFLRRMTVQYGINEKDILLEDKSINTFENVKNSFELSKSMTLKNALVCTSPFHQLRCFILMKKSGFQTFMIAEMPDEFLEMDREEVYRKKRLGVVKDEWRKSVYSLFL